MGGTDSRYYCKATLTLQKLNYWSHRQAATTVVVLAAEHVHEYAGRGRSKGRLSTTFISRSLHIPRP